MVRASAKLNVLDDFYRYGNFPTNGTIAKVTSNDLALFFQGLKLEILISRKQLEELKNLSGQMNINYDILSPSYNVWKLVPQLMTGDGKAVLPNSDRMRGTSKLSNSCERSRSR